jgi:hypothetical protein
MVYRPSKILPWLSVAAAVVLLLGGFAPISDPWDRILSGLGSALILASLAITWREKRGAREAHQSSSAAISSSDQR